MSTSEKSSASRSRAAMFLSSALSVCIAGCLAVPVHTPAHVKTTEGQEVKKLDLSFLASGKTTRDEVIEKIGWMKADLEILATTGWSDACNKDRIFWGRWQQSSSAVVGLYAAPPAPVMLPAGERKWKYHDLLVEFDDRGTVQRFDTNLPDDWMRPDSHVAREVENWLNEANPQCALHSPAKKVPVKNSPAFELLKSFAGSWKGTSSDGRVKSTMVFAVIADGTAVKMDDHIIGEGTWYDVEGKLVTIFSADGDQLVATVRSADESWRMKLTSASGSKLTFENIGIADPKADHIERIVITQIAPDHMVQEWFSTVSGKEDVDDVDLHRVAQPK